MPMRLLVVPPLVLLVAASAAAAEESYPDLVGTWQGLSVGVLLQEDGSGDFFSEEVTQVVTEQKDRRFVGQLTSGQGDEQFRVEFVGIFTDQSHFRWSEPGGFVEGRMLDPNTIDSCYVRTGRENQTATCHILKRQR
jgi:hypothetical protein